MNQRSQPFDGWAQKAGLHLFEAAQLLTGPGGWLVGGLLVGSVLGACVAGWFWGPGWMVALALSGGLMASFMMTILSMWLAVWITTSNVQPFIQNNLAVIISGAVGCTIGLILVPLLMGHWHIVASTLVGPAVLLSLVAFPDKLA